MNKFTKWLEKTYKEIKKIFLNIIGKRYLSNKRSLEIHDLSNTKTNCHIDLIVDKKYINKKQMKSMIKKEYNGCRWCLKKHDTG